MKPLTKYYAEYTDGVKKRQIDFVISYFKNVVKEEYGNSFFCIKESFVKAIQSYYANSEILKERFSEFKAAKHHAQHAYEKLKKSLKESSRVENGPNGSGLYRFLSNHELSIKFESHFIESSCEVGFIYAYSYKHYLNNNEEHVIKIGMASGCYKERIAEQQGTSNPEQPVILGAWKVSNFKKVEKAIHKSLIANGKHYANGAGTEWFVSNVNYINQFMKQNNIQVHSTH